MATPTQAQLDALEAAYYSGALSVGHGDKRVQYRSADEMWQAIQRTRRAMGGTVGQAVFAEPRRI